jgi:hypothetical protein
MKIAANSTSASDVRNRRSDPGMRGVAEAEAGTDSVRDVRRRREESIRTGELDVAHGNDPFATTATSPVVLTDGRRSVAPGYITDARDEAAAHLIHCLDTATVQKVFTPHSSGVLMPI